MATWGDYFAALDFQAMPPSALVCLALWLVLSAAAGLLWAGAGPAARRWIVGLMVAVTLLAAWLTPIVDHDEVEHLHISWLMSQGKLPFVDFWEHHSPALWVLLAPLMERMPQDARVIDVARIASLAVSALGWLIGLALVRRIHRTTRAAIWATVLWAAAVLPGQLYNLRPDLPGNALALGALLACLALPAAPGMALSGLLIGLCVSLSPKHLLLIAVFPVAAVLAAPDLPRLLGRWAVYGIGLLLGLAPLAWWLHAHGLIDDFRTMVLGFNTGGKGMQIGGAVPLLPLGLAVWWLVSRLRDGRGLTEAERLLALALGAGLLAFLAQPGNVKLFYNLQMFLILVAVAAPTVAGDLLRAVRSWRGPALAGAVVGLYFANSVVPALQDARERAYPLSRLEVQRLMDVSAGQPVFAMARYHPIFAEDVSQISFRWQWNWLTTPSLARVLSDLPEVLLSERPSLVSADAHLPPLSAAVARHATIGHLFTNGIIDIAQASRLQEFLEREYRLVRIVKHYYWVRKDVHLPASSHVVEVVPPTSR